MTVSFSEDLQHRYRPVGSAQSLFLNRDPEVLLSGSAGTGKSRACLEKLHASAMLNPGMRGLIIRKTAASLGSTGLVTYRNIVAAEDIQAGHLRFYGGSKAQAAAFLYGNGSELVIGGLDKATRIMSSEYDLIYVQEATELSLDDWESLTTRLRNGVISYQQLMADCNPGPPQHWLNRRCLDGVTTMIFCRHEDNPTLFIRDRTEQQSAPADSDISGEWTEPGKIYLSKLDNLTGVRKQRLRYGKWAAAEGLVYDTFDPLIHVRARPTKSFPDHWPRYMVVDFGFTNPFCCQWWAEDEDGRLYLYREIYHTRRLVEEHSQVILDNLGRSPRVVAGRTGVPQYDPEPQATFIICDHDAEDRATLEKHTGLKTIPALKSVSDGIQAVQERLKVQPDGRPRLIFCRDTLIQRDPSLDDSRKPVCTLEELTEYIWDPNYARTTHGSSTGTTLRETPLKQNDHGMDCVRYMVAFRDLQKQVRVRWL